MTAAALTSRPAVKSRSSSSAREDFTRGAYQKYFARPKVLRYSSFVRTNYGRNDASTRGRRRGRRFGGGDGAAQGRLRAGGLRGVRAQCRPRPRRLPDGG